MGNKKNKDILIDLISTLTDDECRDIYNFIQWEEYKDNNIHIDNIILTKQQYNKLIYIWGENKTRKCCSLLSDWLKKKGDKISRKISHYRQLIGWVERKYIQLYPVDKKYNKTNYGSINTIGQAIKYMRELPKDIRLNDPDVRFLVEKYNIDLDKYMKD